MKIKKILRKSLSNFQHYVKKIEAQAKENGFHVRKRVFQKPLVCLKTLPIKLFPLSILLNIPLWVIFSSTF